MRGYLAYFKLRVIASLQYRTAAIAGICTQFFWGLLYLMIYQAFYSGASLTPEYSYQQLTTYIWLQQAFLALIVIWARDAEMSELIRSGGVAYELCRPYNLYCLWFAKQVGQRLANVSLRMVPLLIFSSLLPEPYRLSPPASPQAFLLFLIALAFGLVIIVSAVLIIYLITMITLEQTGVTAFFNLFWDVLSGNVIPVPFMPPALQRLVLWLPCRLSSDLPFRIYNGHIPITEAFSGLALQLFWGTVLIALGLKMMQAVQQRITVQGG